MPHSTLGSRGRLVLPKEVRDHLHVGPGDRIDFVVLADGQVVLRPAVMDARELRGLLAYTDGRVTLGEMNRTIRTRATGD